MTDTSSRKIIPHGILTIPSIIPFCKANIRPDDFFREAESLERVAEDLFGEAAREYQIMHTQVTQLAPMYKELLGVRKEIQERDVRAAWTSAHLIRSYIQHPSTRTSFMGLDYFPQQPKVLVVSSRGLLEESVRDLRGQLNLEQLPENIKELYLK